MTPELDLQLALASINGTLHIPYVEYTVADFQVRGVQVPTRGVVVVKDEFMGDKRAILGMNVIWDCWEELFQRRRANSPHAKDFLIGKGWDDVFIDCQRIQAAVAREDWRGTARLAYRAPVTIPALSEVILWAKIPSRSCKAQQYAMLEPLAEEDSVDVARALITVNKGRFPIRVRNINAFPMTLNQFQRVANVSSVSPEYIRENRGVSLTDVSPGIVEVGFVDIDQELKEASSGKMEFPCIKGADLTEERQLQLDQLIQRWGYVFSNHEEDYGRTDVIQHCMPTGTADPIKDSILF